MTINANNYTSSEIVQYETLVGNSGNVPASISVGTSGYVLTSNGTSANPSYQALTAPTLLAEVNIQSFTSAGTTTYTPTSNMVYCEVICIGGGGGGGGAAGTLNDISLGACGGGGETAYGVFSAATIGASQQVIVGAAGSAGSSGNNAGGNGGASSVGTAPLISANGGTGGSGGAASGGFVISQGGAGGTGGTGGVRRWPGGDGQTAWGTAVLWGSTGCGFSGYGGYSYFGGGGLGAGLQSAGEITGINGAAGLSPGTGGGGGGSLTATSYTGGAGYQGAVYIIEWIS